MTCLSSAPEYWGIEDVMQYLKLKRRQVARLGIPYAKIGPRRYYRPKDVVEFLEGKIR